MEVRLKWTLVLVLVHHSDLSTAKLKDIDFEFSVSHQISPLSGLNYYGLSSCIIDKVGLHLLVLPTFPALHCTFHALLYS
jgi:hypothetical protein